MMVNSVLIRDVAASEAPGGEDGSERDRLKEWSNSRTLSLIIDTTTHAIPLSIVPAVNTSSVAPSMKSSPSTRNGNKDVHNDVEIPEKVDST